jgi:uncharacterized membrane protein
VTSSPRSQRKALRLSGWRRDSLRTSLWFVPSLLVIAAVVLFAITYGLDRAVDNHDFGIPSWVNTGGTAAARTILTSIAAAVITVVGVVFSITILALQLASTQFGPRMLRNFIRDFGTQLTLGTFVGTFVFSVLALGSVADEKGGPFVPHISVTVALVLLIVDLGVLIYFIHHVATSIQVTDVVKGIARDLSEAIDGLTVVAAESGASGESTTTTTETLRQTDPDFAEIPSVASGYLQAVDRAELVRIARRLDATVGLAHRPGHFVVKGRPLAYVWPAGAGDGVARELDRAHAVGPFRTIRQDLQFAIDQLVEIAIRALSPAVNDTFTALTCIDWLGDALCKITATGLPSGLLRDSEGRVRVIEVPLRYERVLNRAFDKIRQAGRGMPAVLIRQLENLAKIAEYTTVDEQRALVWREADMLLRASEESVPEPNDRLDVLAAHETVSAALGAADDLAERRQAIRAPGCFDD